MRSSAKRSQVKDFSEQDEMESLRLHSSIGKDRDVDQENFSVSIGLGPASDNRILNRGRFISTDNRNKAAKKGVVPATRKPDTLHMSPTQILVANQKR